VSPGPNGNGWEREETTQTRIKIQTARDEYAAEARKKLVAWVGGVLALMGGLGGLVAVIAFGLGRAAASDVQALDVRTVRLEQASETQQAAIHEVKVLVDKNEDKAEQRHYRIEHKLDVALDQLQPVARKAGAPIVARPPRAVPKPTAEVSREP
jgi:hypothetical protein